MLPDTAVGGSRTTRPVPDRMKSKTDIWCGGGGVGGGGVSLGGTERTSRPPRLMRLASLSVTSPPHCAQRTVVDNRSPPVCGPVRYGRSAGYRTTDSHGRRRSDRCGRGGGHATTISLSAPPAHPVDGWRGVRGKRSEERTRAQAVNVVRIRSPNAHRHAAAGRPGAIASEYRRLGFYRFPRSSPSCLR